MVQMGNDIKVIVDLARRAGAIQLSKLGKVHKIEYKGVINIATEIDRECEEMIVQEIRKHFPGDDILAEEMSEDVTPGPSKGRRWIIDPLDGTVNYAHGFPFFCVSIALEDNGELVAGVIYDPNRDETFVAEKGKGAVLGGQPIRVSGADSLRQSLLATGFAYNTQEGESLDNLDHFANFVKRARAVRRPGSAAIDLAWVACGRIDGFWELFLKPWDMAAGVVIIREAGGLVTSFDGSPFELYGTEILASNGKIHGEMSQVLEDGRKHEA